ncbi:IS3 family transposase [Streptomyces sp. NPDC056661]|uniref:IS3 family transposase n=1 Tax=Streptomyces sp. NPDC056661 TaxID=3345898 RepID=UPI0036A8CBF1
MNGKSETLDAENGARAILAGFASAMPKGADDEAEMIRPLKIVHGHAVEQRTAAMVTMKAMLVHAPDPLRNETAGRTQIAPARHLAGLRPRQLDAPEDALRHALRTLAKRWQYLDAEANDLTKMIADLVHRAAPQLLEPFGIGVDTAAEILVVAGDSPERIKGDRSRQARRHRARAHGFRKPDADRVAQPPPLAHPLELTNAIFEYLEIFRNQKRRHSALGMLTPIEFELRATPSIA